MAVNQHKGSFWGDETILKLDYGALCTTLYVCEKSLTCTPNSGEFHGIEIIAQ